MRCFQWIMSCTLGMCQIHWTTSHYIFSIHLQQLPIMICIHIHHEWCYFSWRIYFPCRKRRCCDIKAVNKFIVGDWAQNNDMSYVKISYHESIFWKLYLTQYYTSNSLCPLILITNRLKSLYWKSDLFFIFKMV